MKQLTAKAIYCFATYGMYISQLHEIRWPPRSRIKNCASARRRSACCLVMSGIFQHSELCMGCYMRIMRGNMQRLERQQLQQLRHLRRFSNVGGLELHSNESYASYTYRADGNTPNNNTHCRVHCLAISWMISHEVRIKLHHVVV